MPEEYQMQNKLLYRCERIRTSRDLAITRNKELKIKFKEIKDGK